MAVKRNEKGEFSHIECDVCEIRAPEQADVAKGGGLNNMGWQCSGGRHLCPEHVS